MSEYYLADLKAEERERQRLNALEAAARTEEEPGHEGHLVRRLPVPQQ